MAKLDDTDERNAQPVRGLLLALLGVLVVCGVAGGVWFWRTVTARAVVPDLSGLTPASASAKLRGERLADGHATYRVTDPAVAGRIVGQSPKAHAAVAQGSAVDVSVAVAARAITVPDVRLAQDLVAEQVMRANLLEPTILHAYTKDVVAGLVIEQLPRAGDTAITGSACVLVVSLGPGVGGKIVPPAIGLRLEVARSRLASATLLADVRSVAAAGVASGTVVDQAPSAGLTVPVVSKVTLAVAGKRP